MNAIKHSASARASQPPITRRQALRAIGHGTAAGATMVLPIAAAATAGPSPDAELLRLGAEFEAAWGRQAAVTLSTPSIGFSESELSAIWDLVSDLADRIRVIPAITLAGLVVKARVVAWCHCDDEVTENSFCEDHSRTTDILTVGAIVADLLRMHRDAYA